MYPYQEMYLSKHHSSEYNLLDTHFTKYVIHSQSDGKSKCSAWHQMPGRGMAVDVHIPGITVTNAPNAAHGNDGMAVDHPVPGIMQLQQSLTLEMQYVGCAISSNNNGQKRFLSKRSATISIYYNGPSNLAIQIHFLEFLRFQSYGSEF